jgi:hypothetical protein
MVLSEIKIIFRIPEKVLFEIKIIFRIPKMVLFEIKIIFRIPEKVSSEIKTIFRILEKVLSEINACFQLPLTILFYDKALPGFGNSLFPRIMGNLDVKMNMMIGRKTPRHEEF